MTNFKKTFLLTGNEWQGVKCGFSWKNLCVDFVLFYWWFSLIYELINQRISCGICTMCIYLFILKIWKSCTKPLFYFLIDMPLDVNDFWLEKLEQTSQRFRLVDKIGNEWKNNVMGKQTFSSSQILLFYILRRWNWLASFALSCQNIKWKRSWLDKKKRPSTTQAGF